MQVKSAPGTQCPKEQDGRQYITDAEPQEVPESAYYLRLIDDGSLIPIPAPLQGLVKGAGPQSKEGNADGKS